MRRLFKLAVIVSLAMAFFCAFTHRPSVQWTLLLAVVIYGARERQSPTL
jgi:hypothetical protein